MSIAISKLVWSMHLPESIPKSKRSTIKLVLLKLSENSDINGKCWPSMGLIAHECELSERTVVRSIKSLSELDIVSVVTKRYNGVKHNTYYLNIKLMSSMKCEYELKVNDDEDNPYKKPTDTQSNPTDIQSKKMDQMSVKPSVTTKEPSLKNTDTFSGKQKEMVNFRDLNREDYPLCAEAMNHLAFTTMKNGMIAYLGKLTVEEWDSCELAMASVDCFDAEYFTWWMTDRPKGMRKTPSLPNMLTDMNGITFEQFYNSTFIQDWE